MIGPRLYCHQIFLWAFSVGFLEIAATPIKRTVPLIDIEPKFVFPEGAVGIENTLVVTTQGLGNLTVFDENIGFLP